VPPELPSPELAEASPWRRLEAFMDRPAAAHNSQSFLPHRIFRRGESVAFAGRLVKLVLAAEEEPKG